MSLSAPDTTLEIEGLLIPLRSALGFSEEWSEDSEPQVFRRWSGRAVVVGPMYKRVHTISIRGGGSAVWRQPALDDLHYGDEVTLHSCKWRTAEIPVGATNCTLPFDYVPGSLSVRRLDTDEKVAFTVVGRVVSIAAPAGVTLVVHYRPLVPSLVVSARGDADGAEGTGTWSLILAQKDPPS
jgi:hypothetical protein